MRYEQRMTVTVDGDERDVPVRAEVEIEWDHGYPRARIDGDPEALVDGAWVSVHLLGMTTAEIERLEEGMGECAMMDDRDECDEMLELNEL